MNPSVSFKYQGKWCEAKVESAEYEINSRLHPEMNYWCVEMTYFAGFGYIVGYGKAQTYDVALLDAVSSLVTQLACALRRTREGSMCGRREDL